MRSWSASWRRSTTCGVRLRRHPAQTPAPSCSTRRLSGWTRTAAASWTGLSWRPPSARRASTTAWWRRRWRRSLRPWTPTTTTACRTASSSTTCSRWQATWPSLTWPSSWMRSTTYRPTPGLCAQPAKRWPPTRAPPPSTRRLGAWTRTAAASSTAGRWLWPWAGQVRRMGWLRSRWRRSLRLPTSTTTTACPSRSSASTSTTSRRRSRTTTCLASWTSCTTCMQGGTLLQLQRQRHLQGGILQRGILLHLNLQRGPTLRQRQPQRGATLLHLQRRANLLLLQKGTLLHLQRETLRQRQRRGPAPGQDLHQVHGQHPGRGQQQAQQQQQQQQAPSQARGQPPSLDPGQAPSQAPGQALGPPVPGPPVHAPPVPGLHQAAGLPLMALQRRQRGQRGWQ
mmetsp:Transcript_10004/g.21376  ORF Transcript_10004/g.21376 Transcript_10004/m.21376 type:complete len:397 (-) Transcript_10004:212-1402(-)